MRMRMMGVVGVMVAAVLGGGSAGWSAEGVTSVGWLDQVAPGREVGVSFGVPFAEGMVKKGEGFTLMAEGVGLPTQTWPLAYWPDGSMKWVGFATVAGGGGAGVKGPVEVVRGVMGDQIGPMVKVVDGAEGVTIDTGKVVARIPKSGRYLIDSLSVGGKEVARHGELECIDQEGAEEGHLSEPARADYFSEVKKVTVEQAGPVRAVVKIEGVHRLAGAGSEGREWLPFVVRLYFYAGEAPVRMVHTVVFDGDKDKDFIRGLGVVFEVPLREQSQNRHVRFGNSNGGVWAEPVQLVVRRGRGAGFGGSATGPNQIEGERLVNVTTPPESAEWEEFRLVQPNSEGFVIEKRTNPKSSWVGVGEGQRAAGSVFIGDVSGGLGVGVKNFWQSYPGSLEVTGGMSEAAHVTAWLWSPEGPAMDMRHYDTHGHGNVNTGGSYEDYEPAFATPVGVARTSELMLFPEEKTPTREVFAAETKVTSEPPLLVSSPQYLHDTKVFGVWSVQDRSTPFKKAIEDRLDGAIAYYEKAIDEQHWYGFWNFGDVRHAYDPARHEWRYDIGGYAWDNSELGSVLWMWDSYIRTGRADIFRMAEAMIRQTSEVDTYHLGPYAGLGSRHNVSHWGDSAKEARVSQSAHAQYYYFLTTDERMGDIITAEAGVDEVASKLDPMRKAQPLKEGEKKYPGRIRVGPDWLAFAGNWMIEWERTGDVKWRDKIMAGVDSLYAMPYWMRSGEHLVMGYDYNTGKLYQTSPGPGVYNLATIQGGAEVAFQLTDLLNSEKWSKMWLQYCRLGSADAATLTKDQQTGNEGADATLVGEQGGANSQGTPRLCAYVYWKTKNVAYAERAVRYLESLRTDEFVPRRVEGAQALNPMEEVAGASTNTTAQTSLTAIEILELCADQLPHDVVVIQPGGGRGRRGGEEGAATGPGGGG